MRLVASLFLLCFGGAFPALAQDTGMEGRAADGAQIEPGTSEIAHAEEGEVGSEPASQGEALSLNLDALSPTNVDVDIRDSPRVLALSEALALPAFDFDGLSFISATRSLVTGVFETYCAANAFLSNDIGAGEVLIGIGCTLGAATLFVLGIRNLVSPRERREGLERFIRFETLRAEGALDEPTLGVFEEQLVEAAARGRRRRVVEIVFGGLNLVASATLIGLTARKRIDRTAGITIASGTFVLGIMGLMAIFARSPADRAYRDYRLRF